jgi:hypothetical protein
MRHKFAFSIRLFQAKRSIQTISLHQSCFFINLREEANKDSNKASESDLYCCLLNFVSLG